MSKRRPLTAKEKLVQTRLREIWQAKKKALDLTQEKAAHQFGWSSQGAVGAYLLGRTPVNTDALLKFAKLLEVKPTDIDPDFAWGDMVVHDHAKGTGKSDYSFKEFRKILEQAQEGVQEAPSQEADIPKHVRDLVDAILLKARNGSLTKEHTAVLKSSLELMTGHKK